MRKSLLTVHLSLPRKKKKTNKKGAITLLFPFLLIWAQVSLEMSRPSSWGLGTELFCQLTLAGKASASEKLYGGARSVESFIEAADKDSWI